MIKKKILSERDIYYAEIWVYINDINENINRISHIDSKLQ